MIHYLEIFNVYFVEMHSKDGIIYVFSFRWTPTTTLNVFLLSIVASKYGGVNSMQEYRI